MTLSTRDGAVFTCTRRPRHRQHATPPDRACTPRPRQHTSTRRPAAHDRRDGSARTPVALDDVDMGELLSTRRLHLHATTSTPEPPDRASTSRLPSVMSARHEPPLHRTSRPAAVSSRSIAQRFRHARSPSPQAQGARPRRQRARLRRLPRPAATARAVSRSRGAHQLTSTVVSRSPAHARAAPSARAIMSTNTRSTTVRT